jgi:hypothetical protein
VGNFRNQKSAVPIALTCAAAVLFAVCQYTWREFGGNVAFAQSESDQPDLSALARKSHLRIKTSSTASPLGMLTIQGAFDTSSQISVLFTQKGKTATLPAASATASSIQVVVPPLEGRVKVRVRDGAATSNSVKVNILPLPTSNQPVGTVTLTTLQALQTDPNIPPDLQTDLASIIETIQEVLNGTEVEIGTHNGQPVFVTMDAVSYMDRIFLASQQAIAGQTVSPSPALTFDQPGEIGLDSQANTISDLLYYYGLVQVLLVAIPILLVGGSATAVAGLTLQVFGYIAIIVTLSVALGFYLFGDSENARESVCDAVLAVVYDFLSGGLLKWLKAPEIAALINSTIGQELVGMALSASTTVGSVKQQYCSVPTPTPTATATATATVTATPAATATETATPTATPTSTAFQFTVPSVLPPAFIGLPYSYSFCAPVPPDGICGSDADPPTTNPTGGLGQYVFSMSGDEPGGMSLDSISGLLSGTAPGDNFSPYTFSVCATDQGGGKGATTICQTTMLTYLDSATYTFSSSGTIGEAQTPTPSCSNEVAFDSQPLPVSMILTVSLDSPGFDYPGPANVSGSIEINELPTFGTPSFLPLCSGINYGGSYDCTGTLSSIVGPATMSMNCVGPLVTIPFTLSCAGSLADNTSICSGSSGFVDGSDSATLSMNGSSDDEPPP